MKGSKIDFGITPETAESLPNPAELFLGSLSACMLKNVERFSQLMKFTYSNASISLEANRLEKPPKIDEITYHLKIYSKEPHINQSLLKKNIENYGTIFNTVKAVCIISGTLEIIN